jgi:hypothetical protein
MPEAARAGGNFLSTYARHGLLRDCCKMKRTPKDRLKLYSQLLPQATLRQRDGYDPFLWEHISLLSEATVFDCRQMPVGWVQNSGDTACDEIVETGGRVRLPFPVCYFEFSADSPFTAVLAEEVEVYPTSALPPGAPPLPGKAYDSSLHRMIDDRAAEMDGEVLWRRPASSLGTVVRVRFYSNVDWAAAAKEDPEPFRDMMYGALFNGLSADFPNGVISPAHPEGAFFVPFAHWAVLDADDEQQCRFLAIAAILLIGIVSLLTDKLLIDRFAPDPAPWWTRGRRKKGKPPTNGDTHILTVNVPAVRYAVSRSVAIRGNSQESPALHWRRGHWRAYHRGSEFEHQGWVRRCLVGDPAKGFVRPAQYRLTHEPPLLHVIDGGLGR